MAEDKLIAMAEDKLIAMAEDKLIALAEDKLIAMVEDYNCTGRGQWWKISIFQEVGFHLL